MTIEEHVSLADLTTFKVGGAARFFVRVTSLNELKEALLFAASKRLPVFFLGGGSNTLVGDNGFDGLVVKISLTGIERQQNTYVSGAGESWDLLVARTVDDGQWGLENLSGIPGTVGGAVVQNIGAYGAALSQTLVWVDVYDIETSAVRTLSNAECMFGYRTSILKERAGRYVVLRAAFTVTPDARANFAYQDANRAYKDLSRIFSDNPAPSVAEVRAAVLSIRADKFPDLSVEGTAGSFFLNPVVPKTQALLLQEQFPDMPLFSMPETTDVKVPLGWILDRALGLKGYAVGAARLFEKQALVVVAARGACADDVLQLVERVKKEVKEKIGLEIKEEVRIIS